MQAIRVTALAAALSVTPAIVALDRTEPAWSWEGVERVVAIGDVHGADDKLRTLLSGLGLVDGELGWSGGETHLVFCGDLVDRGPADREVLDLARRLQQEAQAAGGRVHVVLGNHELMNLVGDLRYVSPESFAEFAGEETDADRAAGWQLYRRNNPSDATGLRAAFEEERPPGYFSRVRAFAPEGEYGAWLLEQPTVVKINGVVFVHGGLTPRVAALGLDGINRAVRDDVTRWLELRERSDETSPYLAMRNSLAFSTSGPLWYRGNSLENERLLRGPLADTLEKLGARALVVAHTPTGEGHVTARLGGRLYRTDVGMAYGGDPAALIFGGDDAWAFDPATLSRRVPAAEPPQGEGYSCYLEELPGDDLESFLAKAKVVSSERRQREGRHVGLLHLERKGLKLRGVFRFVEETPDAGTPPEAYNPRRYQHEIAAYLLDQRLGLGMVPPAVPRKVDGTKGAVSLFVESAVDLPYLLETDMLELVQGLDREIAQARIFTALIGNRDRHDMAKMLIPPERKIMIGDNSKGFPLSTEIADFLTLGVPGIEVDVCDFGPALAGKLRGLEAPALSSELKPYLSPAQVDALLVRRNNILAACSE